MIQVKVSHVVNAPTERVWDLLADVTTVTDYHPHVKSVDLASPNKEGVGATRVCHFYDGTSVKEQVTITGPKQNGGGQRMELALSEYSFPMKEFDAAIEATPVVPGKTEVSMILNFTVKYGPLGYLMGVALMKPKMKGLVKSVLEGVEYHLATGNQVAKHGKE